MLGTARREGAFCLLSIHEPQGWGNPEPTDLLICYWKKGGRGNLSQLWPISLWHLGWFFSTPYTNFHCDYWGSIDAKEDNAPISFIVAWTRTNSDFPTTIVHSFETGQYLHLQILESFSLIAEAAACRIKLKCRSADHLHSSTVLRYSFENLKILHKEGARQQLGHLPQNPGRKWNVSPIMEDTPPSDSELMNQLWR